MYTEAQGADYQPRSAVEEKKGTMGNPRSGMEGVGQAQSGLKTVSWLWQFGPVVWPAARRWCVMMSTQRTLLEVALNLPTYCGTATILIAAIYRNHQLPVLDHHDIQVQFTSWWPGSCVPRKKFEGHHAVHCSCMDVMVEIRHPKPFFIALTMTRDSHPRPDRQHRQLP